MSAIAPDDASRPQDPAPTPQQEVRAKRPPGIWLCIVFIQLVLLFRLSMAIFSQRMDIAPPGIGQHQMERVRTIRWVVLSVRSLSLVAVAVFLARLRRLAIPFLDAEVILSVLGTVLAALTSRRLSQEYAGWFFWVWAANLPWLLLLRYVLQLRKKGILTDLGIGPATMGVGPLPTAPPVATAPSSLLEDPAAWTTHHKILRFAWFAALFCLWVRCIPLVREHFPAMGNVLWRATIPIFLFGLLHASRKPRTATDARQEIRLDPIRKTPWF